MIERPELVARALAVPSGGVVSIVAPAGFGKSALIDAIRAAWGTSAFLALGPQHDDPVRFRRELLAAFGCDPGIIATAPAIDTAAFVDLVIGMLDDEAGPVALVLDDVHEVTNRVVLDAIGRIARADRSSPLLLSSRRTPGIGMSALKVGRRVVEIEADALAFDAAAAMAVAREFAPDVDEAILAAHLARLEGWPAGVVLLGLAFSRGDQFDSAITLQSDLLEFIGDAVVGELPEELATFLLELSVVGVFRPETVVASTGRDDAVSLLVELVSSRIFIEPDRQRPHWLRFHDLVGATLRRLAARLGRERWCDLQRRTISVLREMGEVDIATDLLLAVDDRDLLTELLISGDSLALGFSTFARGETLTIGRLHDRVSVDDFGDDVNALQVGLSTALAVPDLRRSAEFGAALDRLGALEAADASPVLIVLSSILNGHLGDIATALKRGEQAERAIARMQWQDSFPDFLVATTIAFAALMAGQSDTARQRGRHATDLGSRLGAVTYMSGLYAATGIAAWMSGDHDEAVLSLQQSIAAAEKLSTFVDLPLRGSLQALSMINDGDVEGARGVALATIAHPDFVPAILLSSLPVLILGATEVRLGLVAPADLRAAPSGGLGAVPVGAGVFAGLAAALDLPESVLSADQAPAAPTGVGGPAHQTFQLSDRERTIFGMLQSRLTLREIGSELYLSVNTVKTHTQSIYRKLGVGSRNEAAALLRSGRW